jgi:hypothetical protein
MKLAEFDPGGRLSNRPLGSLREIFLAWRPNTYTRLEERIAVLRSICRKRPKVGLKLTMSLLPSNHDYSGGTAKPRIKDFGEAHSKPTTSPDVHYAFQQYAALAVELAGTDASQLMALIDSLPQLEPSTRGQAMLAISTSAKNASSDAAFQLWSKLHDLVQKHLNFRDAAWALPAGQLQPLEELCHTIEPADPVRQIMWLFNEHTPTAGSPRGQDYLGEANRDRANALGALLRNHGLAAVFDLARAAKLPHFVGIALVESNADLDVLQKAASLAMAAQSDASIEFAISLSAAAHHAHAPAWDNWIAGFATTLAPPLGASLFLRWPDTRETWDFVGTLSPEIENEYWRRKWAFRPSSPEDLALAFNKYVQVGRFSGILRMISYSESALSTAQCIEVLQGLIGELNRRGCQLQDVQYEVVHIIQALQERQDVNTNELAAIEYQFLPLLEFHAEPIALNRALATSPELFMSVIRDAFSPASGEPEEITDERRLRARLAYQLLHSMKTVPGFSADIEDLNYLRSWITEVRMLAGEADRAVITDQQIGQILAFAPLDREDQAWPVRAIRDLIEELGAEQIELGISVSRFNQRGGFTKAIYEGGKQEKALAAQYRTWADAARNWPRTRALLRRIAGDWDRQAEMADSEAQLDQLRHTH